MPEKFPVQEHVDDEQGSKSQAPVIMHRDPLVPGKTKIGCPVSAPPDADGRNKYNTSPEINEGMNVIRQPISTSALMVTRFIRILIVTLKIPEFLNTSGTGRSPGYYSAIRLWIELQASGHQCDNDYTNSADGNKKGMKLH